MALMLEMRWARKALATSLDSSEDQRLVVRMRSRGNPTGVNADEGGDGGLRFRGGFAADEDAVGILQICDGGAFCEEFGVG